MNKTLNDRVLIQAHRGASAYAPENTLAAFKLAVEMQADGVELDVHLTKDGVPVVNHNFHVNDTSNGRGDIKDMTLDEIRKFNFAFRYNSTELADKYGFQPIPTLEDVYALLSPTGMFVNVELKSTEEELLEKCNALADKYEMKGKVLYSSFDHRALMRIHEYDPTVTVAPLYAQRIQFPWVYASLLGAMAIHPDWGQVFDIPEMVTECHKRGIRVNVWTVDGEDAMRRLIEAGVDSLITDVPDLARKVVGEYFEL